LWDNPEWASLTHADSSLNVVLSQQCMDTADDLEKWVLIHTVFAAAVTGAMHCIN